MKRLPIVALIFLIGACQSGGREWKLPAEIDGGWKLSVLPPSRETFELVNRLSPKRSQMGGYEGPGKLLVSAFELPTVRPLLSRCRSGARGQARLFFTMALGLWCSRPMDWMRHNSRVWRRRSKRVCLNELHGQKLKLKCKPVRALLLVCPCAANTARSPALSLLTRTLTAPRLNYGAVTRPRSSAFGRSPIAWEPNLPRRMLRWSARFRSKKGSVGSRCQVPRKNMRSNLMPESTGPCRP